MNDGPVFADLLRELTPQVLGTLIRRHGQFDACEDATQEALLAAATQWPDEGVPDNPRGWLLTVATRRLTDAWRSDSARRRREEREAELGEQRGESVASYDEQGVSDDTLTLLFLCCHPKLSPPSQLALTLRAVGGLTTAQIAHAFLVPEATMAQRISRAKQTVRSAGASFAMPPRAELAGRLQVVLHVLYLIFNEGYTSSSGEDLDSPELAREAIRLTRMVHDQLRDDGEASGLLALMLLTDARRPARTGPDGSLIPLAEQDRTLWERLPIKEGLALIHQALTRTQIGPYQLQAAIVAVHTEATTAADTDWEQILGLYEMLGRLAPNPMVTLNRAIALAMVKGPRAGLELLDQLEGDTRLNAHHRLDAVRAHLLERAGDHPAAREHYERAARRTTSLPEQRYLQTQARRLHVED